MSKRVITKALENATYWGTMAAWCVSQGMDAGRWYEKLADLPYTLDELEILKFSVAQEKIRTAFDAGFFAETDRITEEKEQMIRQEWKIKHGNDSGFDPYWNITE